MDTRSYRLWIPVTMTFLLLGARDSRAKEEGRVLFDFAKPKAAEDWRSVNDGVMGGVSDGRLRITDEGTLEFYGTLSLANNGGFASVRSKPKDLGVAKGNILVVRLRGDGRRYYVNLYVPSSRTAFSYRAPVLTKAGEWQEVRLSLDRFQATWFGRTLSDAAPVDPAKVRSVGFLLADKKAGPFRLAVEWIKVVGKTGP